MTSPTTTEEARTTPEIGLTALLSSFPVIAAAFVAVLYTAGAVMKTAQLMAADVSVTEILPMVPLQQLLALGIGAAASSVPWIVLYALLGCVMATRPLDAPPQREPQPIFSDFPKELFVGAVLLGLVAPYGYAAVIALSILSVTPAIQWTLNRGKSPKTTMLAHAALSTLVFVTVMVYAYPRPLPAVSIEPETGPEVQGTLALQTSDAYHVRIAKDRVLIIPSSQVKRVDQLARERGQESHLLGDLLALVGVDLPEKN